MKNQNLFMLIGIILLGLFSSCKKDDAQPDPTPPTPASNVVLVEYNINKATTWHADSIYVIPHSLQIDAILTIQPGCIVKFKDQAGLLILDNGKISAIGTQEKIILFTSFKHDAAGGDTNKDGDASSPAPGDWFQIDLRDHQLHSQFQFCHFLYGGNVEYSGVLILGTQQSNVEYCHFAYNLSYVNYPNVIGALAAEGADPSCVVENNYFYENTAPISIDGHFSLNNSNSFFHPLDQTVGNFYNGIFVYGQDIIAHNTTWEETEVAFVILYDGFEVWDNYSLTLGDNVVLKMMEGAMLDIQQNALLINAQGSGVVFTSFKDDDAKGDTNGDGDLTFPPPANDWLGIYNNDYFYTWPNIHYSKNDF